MNYVNGHGQYDPEIGSYQRTASLNRMQVEDVNKIASDPEDYTNPFIKAQQ